MAINEGRVSGSVTAINLAARAKAFVFGALLIWSMGDVCIRLGGSAEMWLLLWSATLTLWTESFSVS